MSSNPAETINFLYPENRNLVSIVIPVYNGGKYLKQMLDSIYNQTYKEIEVIAAYDTKSTDNSLEILKQYRDKYGLIIDEARDSSAGSARNRGARLAKGEYVIFLDADDTIIPTYLEYLVEPLLKYSELDISHSDYLRTNENNIGKILTKKQADKQYTLQKNITLLPDFIQLGFGMPWNFLVRRKYISEYSIHFPDRSWGEDTEYAFQLLFNTETTICCSIRGYIWIDHPNSLTNTSNALKRLDARRQSLIAVQQSLSKKHPDIASEFTKNYTNIIDREFVGTIKYYEYDTFIQLLEKENIHKLSSFTTDSYQARLSTTGFNCSKRLWWMTQKFIKNMK